MFSPSPSSAAVFQRETLPRVTLGIRFSVFGHLVPNVGIGMSANFLRDLYYIWTGSVFVLFSVISFWDSPWQKDGWMRARHRIPRVMDLLWTFALAIVRVFPERWVSAAQKKFSLRDGFSPCSSDSACSVVAERSVSTAQSDCVGCGIHRSAGMPSILAAELLRISAKQCIPTAKKSCGHSRVLTFFQTRSDSGDSCLL